MFLLLPGVANAQCSIVINATPTICGGASSNTYTMNGTVTIANPPATGSLIISVQGGGSQVFTAPFASSYNYSIQKLVADGVTHQVTANFTAGCSATTNALAPTPVGTGFYTFPLNSILADAYYGQNPHPNAYVDAFYMPGSWTPQPNGLVGEAFDLDLQPAGATNLAGFCVELWEGFGGTTHYYNKYQIVPLENISKGCAGVATTTSVHIPVGGIGKVRAGMLRYLFDNYYVSTNVGSWSNDQAAAFQYAVWEISHEVYSSNNSFSISTVSTNGFYTTSSFSPTIVNLCNSYLNAINTLNWTDAQWMSYQSVNFHVFAAEHDENPDPNVADYQDFLFAQPIICTVPPCTPPSAITFSQVAPTCTGATSNNNGTISLTAVSNGTHYGVSALNAASYNGPAFASATAIPALPAVIQSSIPNTGGSYIVRIFNGANDCYTDQTVTVAAVTCSGGGTCSGGSLLMNSSFDAGPFNGSGEQSPTVPGWTGSMTAATNVALNGGGGTYVIPDGVALGYSQAIANTFVYQQVAATPGNTYTLSFWAGMHEPAQDDGIVKIQYYDSGNAPIGTAQVHEVTYDVETNWPNPTLGGPYTLNLAAAPANAASVRVTFGLTVLNAGWDAVKVDAFCLTESAPACTAPSGIAFSQVAPTCTGATSNNNGTISLTAATNGTHYGVSALNAASYDGPAFASATAIPALPAVVKSGVPNSGGFYVIRIFNGANDCYTDQSVTENAVPCNCPTIACGITSVIKN